MFDIEDIGYLRKEGAQYSYKYVYPHLLICQIELRL